MLYTIKNNLLQPIFCNLADGTPFMLMSKGTPNLDTVSITDKQMTSYLKNLSNDGYVSIKEVVNSDTTTKKKTDKEKEEK